MLGGGGEGVAVFVGGDHSTGPARLAAIFGMLLPASVVPGNAGPVRGAPPSVLSGAPVKQLENGKILNAPK